MKNMEKIIKQLSLLLVLAYLHLKAGNSELTAFPHDTEVLVNHSTYFNCSTSIRSEQIHWYHYRVGENRTNYVFYKGLFNQIYADRYSIAIDNVTGEYNLIIRSAQPGDAGRYECQDDGGLGNFSSAELIILDSTPTCQSSMKPEGLVGPNSCGLPIDELQISCSVSYSGNIPSTLQWKMEGDESDDAPISKGTAIDHPGKRVTMNLTMSSEIEMDRAIFTCSTTRSHDKQYSCTTGPVEIHYAVDQPTILNITKGQTITCAANATVPCTYKWFHGNDTLCSASCNQVLTTTRLGDHSCEASCTINGISCTFVAIRIFVFENEASTASENTTKTLLLAILIPTLAILLIIACVLIFIIRKAMVANKVLKVENAVIQSRPANEVSNEVSVPNENPSADNEVEMQPLLTAASSAATTIIVAPPACTGSPQTTPIAGSVDEPSNSPDDTTTNIPTVSSPSDLNFIPPDVASMKPRTKHGGTSRTQQSDIVTASPQKTVLLETKIAREASDAVNSRNIAKKIIKKEESEAKEASEP